MWAILKAAGVVSSPYRAAFLRGNAEAILACDLIERR